MTFILGFGAGSIGIVLAEWLLAKWSARPRRVDFARDYFDPCGRDCDNRRR